jgi:nitrate reductase assembly molybdenum cofactor insertion protein NarJ
MNASISKPDSLSKIYEIDILAELLFYPQENYFEQVQEVRDHLFAIYPQASARLNEYLSKIKPHTTEELEERYLAAFELNSSGILYTGIHLFGEESFKRGAFMAELNARYQKAGLHLSNELTDHVAVVLKFYARTPEEDQAELAQYVLLGTLEKIAHSSDFYESLFDAVLEVVRADHPGVQAAPFPIAMTPASCAVPSSTEGSCASACGMKGAGMGDRDFLTSEEES